MRLGLGSYACAWAIGVPDEPPARPMTAIGFLERAARLGVRVVQAADNLPLDRLSPEAFAAFERRAAELGIDVEVGTRGIGIEHLRAWVALAARIRSPILRLVVDAAAHKPSPDEVVETLRPLLPDLDRAGVTLAIENHDRFRSSALARIIERLGSDRVGVCLDAVNSFGSLEGPQAVLATLGPWVVSLHIKDFRIRRADHRMGFLIEGTPAGRGALDVPWLLHTLADLGRDPNAILELWTPPEPSVEETIEKEAAWTAESIAYLRTLIAA
ncbi:MAG: sugar phosphate isomerase/epimerase [Planctomycetes bacterium]|nr:sugar phosphate isomerase/epimerase [Planctomycetota bacterium]